MVLRDVVDRKLALLDGYIGYLERLATNPLEAFVEDYALRGAARYYLQASIECCIDIGTHIIATDTARRAEDYRSVFRVLGEEGIVPADLAEALVPAASLRNRLVHGYDRIDDARVHEYLATAPAIFQRFLRTMAAYLERAAGE